jgi:hypothetical protein
MHIARQCICCASEALEKSPAVLMPFVAHRVFGWTPVEITPDWGLRTAPTGHAYPLCNSVECQACGTLFLDIRFDGTEMDALYGGYRGPEYATERERFEPGYLAHNAEILVRSGGTKEQEAFLAPHVPVRPRVLDWGGDSGAHTPFRGTAGVLHVFDVSGHAVVEGASAVGRSEIAAGAYDLVVLSHVLEHIPEPADLLADVRPVLGAGTVLYVEVPHEPLVADAKGARGLAARKKHWHEHVNFFTEAGLRALLHRAGLEIVDFEVRSRWSHASFSEVLAFACRAR